jgi:N-methylhydantoinase A
LISKRPASRSAEKPAFRRIHSAGTWHDTPVYARSSLPVTKLRGPALILDYGSTTLIPTGWSFSVDKFGSLKITRG